MSGEIAVGIDFGTTSTVVAVVRNGIANTIPDISGQKSIPSYICFRNKTNEIKVGTAAKKFEIIDSENTISGFKRLIGRKYLDKEVIKEMKNLSYDIRKEENEEIGINVYFHGKKESYSPQELVNILFGHVKEVLEKKLNSDVKKVVLTVPTTFHHHQRVLIQEAAEKAGFQVLEIMNEPTAAALAYGIDYVQNYEEKKIVVFDMGGGTLDISILNIKNQLIQVLATGGNSQLGGRDFDSIISNYLYKEIRKKSDIELTFENTKLLLHASEKAKEELSFQEETEIWMDKFNFKMILTRNDFEEKCEHLFNSAKKSFINTLRKADLKAYDIDEVLLVGGSTRIPQIQNLLRKLLPADTLRVSNELEGIVACGAALRAGILNGEVSTKFETIAEKEKSVEDNSANSPPATCLVIQDKGELVVNEQVAECNHRGQVAECNHRGQVAEYDQHTSNVLSNVSESRGVFTNDGTTVAWTGQKIKSYGYTVEEDKGVSGEGSGSLGYGSDISVKINGSFERKDYKKKQVKITFHE